MHTFFIFFFILLGINTQVSVTEAKNIPTPDSEVLATNAELAGAVIMPALEKDTNPKRFAQLLCDIDAVSYMVLRSDWNKEMIQTIQKTYDSVCGPHAYPLIVSIDAEPSLLRYRMPNFPVPKTSQLRTVEKSYATANQIATRLRAAGITITFAPVYDSNDNTAIIGNRSFGRDSATIELLTDAYVRGTIDAGVFPTAKHFPGHGHARGDTHKSLQSVPGTLLELQQFKHAIAGAIPLIMVGHLVVKGGDWDSAGVPASLSSKITTRLLRENLGYNGVIITDALNMGAVAANKNVTVDAIAAGADIALFPSNPRVAHQALVKKISSDGKFKSQVILSVKKIKNLQKNILTIKK